MRHNLRLRLSVYRQTILRRFVLLALSSTLFASVRAQTPAIQFVPTVNTYAGGATTSTICANATDSLGDGCLATQAIFANPSAGEADAAGNIYFSDAVQNVVRRIDATTGIITLIAGQVGSTTVCSGGLDAAGDGCLATQALLNIPRCVRIDRAGNIIVDDTANHIIRRIDKTTGVITVLMGQYGRFSATPPSTVPSTPITTQLDNPYYFIFDPAGNLIVAATSGNYNLIALAINGVIDPVNSPVYNLAGTGVKKLGGNGGLATAATFNGQRGLALDAAENVYIADYGDVEIRQVTSPGAFGQVSLAAINAATISAYAGNGTNATTGDGGLAIAAEVSAPQNIDFDNNGNLLISQSSVDVIRQINPITNIITNYAGAGKASFTGDGGPAALATFNVPVGVKVNLGGRHTTFDLSNKLIRNIFPVPFFSATAIGSNSTQNLSFQTNSVTTPKTATSANSEFTIGAASGCTLGTALAANAYCSFPITFTPAGPGLRAGQFLLIDSSGNTYADSLLGVGLSPAAAFYGAPVTTITGNGTAGNSGNAGSASSATINAPRGGAFDSAGNFYFADSGNHVIRKILKTSGAISVVAGTGTSGSTGDGGAATSAALNTPTGVAVDPAGNLYIADSGNNRVRVVSVSTGIISAAAGTGDASYTGDRGLATAATFNNPSGIAIDNAGVLYVADTGNNVLRAFTPGGIVVTLAGNGTPGYTGDGGVPQTAQLKAPTAVTIDLAGNIYVADTGNSVVRLIAPVAAGIINFQANISTYAGIVGGTANGGDGGFATAASLLTPGGLGVDAAGNLYIAAGGVVRMVNQSTGIIVTVAGNGASGSYSGEGGSAIAATFPTPAQDLAVDQVGNIYLSDTAGNRIVEIAGSSAAPIAFGSQTIATSSSPQTTTLFNSGNQPLTITNIDVPTGFTLSTSAFGSCSNTTVLAPSAGCTFTVTFSPTSTANYSSQITITDNSLNKVTATQTIPVTGIGVGHLNPTATKLTYSPATATYGQPVVVTATVTGGVNPTGKVNFVINSSTTVTQSLSTIAPYTATYTLTGLNAGADTVTANYLGDSVNSGSTDNVSLTIQPAVLTVTATNLSKFTTQPTPPLTYQITGEVDGDSVASAYSGVPVISTTALTASPAGTYPITVGLGTLTSTNYNFVFVPGTLTVDDFTISLSPGSLDIASGQGGVVTVTITPSAIYSGTINFSCGTLPTNVLCTFNTPSVVVGSDPVQMQLTISTNNHPAVASNPSPQNSPWEKTKPLFFAFAFPFLSFALSKRRTVHRRLLSAMSAFLLLIAAQSLTGCTPAILNASTFSGVITVTAKDGNNSSAQASLNLTIH